jgi:cystathionine beta-lyase/cystathionine gamma-synthase
MISVSLNGGKERNLRFAGATKLFQLAESLGGVESLISHPFTMTHGAMPASQKQKIGLPESVIRLSVGIEDPEDLIEDLDQAIKKSK